LTSDRLGRGIAVKILSGLIPARDLHLQIDSDDRIERGFDDGSQKVLIKISVRHSKRIWAREIPAAHKSAGMGGRYEYIPAIAGLTTRIPGFAALPAGKQKSPGPEFGDRVRNSVIF
jgi:hypothetical protein